MPEELGPGPETGEEISESDQLYQEAVRELYYESRNEAELLMDRNNYTEEMQKRGTTAEQEARSSAEGGWIHGTARALEMSSLGSQERKQILASAYENEAKRYDWLNRKIRNVGYNKRAESSREIAQRLRG